MVWDSLTDESKKILKIAGEEAGKLGHQVIGTEHLLLAFLIEDQNVTGGFFSQGLGMSYGALYEDIINILGKGEPHERVLKPSPRVNQILNIAENIANQINTNGIEPILILYGLLKEGHGFAIEILKKYEATPGQVLQLVETAINNSVEKGPEGSREKNNLVKVMMLLP